MLNIKKIHLEVSSKCVIKCPRCPRTELKPDTLNKEFSLADFKRAFDPTVLKEIDEMIFCGDIGDPIYARDFTDIVRYIKIHDPKKIIKIVTNGSYKKPEWWEELGMLLYADDIVTFSIDGWDQTSNNQYRVNTDFDSIMEGIRTLKRSSTVHIRWKSIYFAYNEDHMEKIKTVARENNCDDFQTVKSTKFDNQYLIDGRDPLKPQREYSESGQYITDTYVLKRKYEHNQDYTLDRHPWARCMNHAKELFVNVEGLLLPCPWFNSGYLENSFIKKYQKQLNIKQRGLQDILNDPLWQELVESFEHKTLPICAIKCRNSITKQA
jgi:MoaA/NifB/PqqE/SkfB family radical SAM enzyme